MGCMTNTNRAAAALIDFSIARTSIAFGDWTPELHAALVRDADDHLEAEGRWDYWGVRDGAGWRVVLHVEADRS